MWSARQESQLKSGPRETGASNPSRLHELTGQRPVMENGLLSTSRPFPMTLSKKRAALDIDRCGAPW